MVYSEMEQMNVLVISYYFPPMGLSGVQRTLKFVKYLPLFGWNPIVLTTNVPKYYAFDEDLINEIGSLGIEVYRTEATNQTLKKIKKFPSTYWFHKLGRIFLNFFLQPDTKITWKKKAIVLGRDILRKHNVDVIYSTAPPFTDFLVAQQLSREFNVPFVVDYRDVWVDNPFQLYPTLIHKNFSRKLEEEVLKEASSIIVTYRGTKEILLSRYQFLKSEDITIIPHGFDSEDFDKYGSCTVNPRKFVVTHSGLFQDDRNPKYFLKAFSQFIEERKDEIVKEAWFIGLMRKSHFRYIRRYKLEQNVKLFGYQPHQEVIRLLCQSNVLWLVFEDNVRSPGKLFEYFGARKPILICAPDGYMKRLALESNCAIGVEPRDVEGIFHALNTFYDFWSGNSLPRPSEDFVKKFDRKILTSELARQLSLSCKI